MSIIALFCEIDDFFVAYEKWIATYCLPEETPPIETRGRPPKASSERGDDAADRLPSKWVSDV